MADALKPRNDTEVIEAVRWAIAEEKTLEVVGRGTKRMVGRAAQTDLSLDVSALSGVTLYEPEELVLSAEAGTPIAEIEKLLAKSNQELAFEPVDLGPLLGGKAGEGSLGGVVATNLSGPRRIKAGAVRDHALGVAAVSGRGEAFKAGGRVVKNVTGYDLPRFLTGSWGTLAVATSWTLKVLPAAEDVATLVVPGLDAGRAGEAMRAAMNTAADVSGAAHFPAKVAARLGGPSFAGKSVTALRLEGVPPSIAYRRDKLAEMLKPFGAPATLGAAESRTFWQAVRDAKPFADGSARVVWRISVPPTLGPATGTALAVLGADIFYDWAGGLIWAEMQDDRPREVEVRAALDGQGHALLVRASVATRASTASFEPLEPDVAALVKRLKESFDPRGILNPGRMYAGM
jgi:glycolate dehydrogenase FAD-binding subunit